MTSSRSGLRLLRLTTDASHHGADRAPRQGDRSVLGPPGETQRSKISLVAAIALMLAGVGVWATSAGDARYGRYQIDGRRHQPDTQALEEFRSIRPALCRQKLSPRGAQDFSLVICSPMQTEHP